MSLGSCNHYDHVIARSLSVGPLIRQGVCSPYLVRIKRDIADIAADPPSGIYIAATDDDIATIDAMVIGPADTPYEGGFFRFLIACPTTYPNDPPSVRFLTTDGGKVQMHPRLYMNGYVSLDIIDGERGWSPAQSLSSLFVSLRSLFTVVPLCDALHAVRGQLDHSAQCYAQFVRHECVRVAVCDAVESCLQDSPLFPKAFKETVLRKFLEFYGKYEKALKEQRHLNGSEMCDLIGGTKGNFRHDMLLARLQDIRERIVKRNNTVLCV
ncbi:hypothetical protein HPB50_007022 [Hyalomma asiaticum]|uniref:Uncharacterized protein n=1 Tax=Hyalomma asiaticum TaxID=266040 RepID=A0ACB7T406_HYAAI|nr:hypothetical protein HPB50_007022 [Hyalomma asiaticum]